MMRKLFVFLSLVVLIGCSGRNNRSCDNSALYGYVNICLPQINGMTECRVHPNIQQLTQQYLASGPVLGYYLNNETYKQIDKVAEPSAITYQDYFMIYGDYQRENYNATERDLELMEKSLEQALFEGRNFEQISSRIEEAYGTIVAGQPALLEKYSPQKNVRTMIVLMKYKNEDSETSVISAVDCILLKNRLINLAYYVTYGGGKSIDLVKEKNNEVIRKLMEIN